MKKTSVLSVISFLLVIAVVFSVVVLCIASATNSNYVAVLQSWQETIKSWFNLLNW